MTILFPMFSTISAPASILKPNEDNKDKEEEEFCKLRPVHKTDYMQQGISDLAYYD